MFGTATPLYAKMISKSAYLAGLQCQKLLWHVVNAPQEVPAPDASAQANFHQGDAVGRLARELFPDGLIVDGAGHGGVLAQTQAALAHRVPLCEAAFAHQRAFARVDILVPVTGTAWDLIEVKSSTEVKVVHLDDLAFQAHVLHGAGISIRRFWLAHVNNAYVRRGDVKPSDLFTLVDVTGEVLARRGTVGDLLQTILRTTSAEKCSAQEIGNHCDDPYRCPLHDRCWEYLPPTNVTTLYRGRTKGFALLATGTTKIANIPAEHPLTDSQAIQRSTAQSGQPHVDKAAIEAFLEKLVYPLSYLDFESVATAIPLFENARPYEQIVFQFSLHVVSGENAQPEHFAFLADGLGDPRESVVDSLMAQIPDHGSVVVYNATFERGRLEEFALQFPEFKVRIESILARVVDLLEPFRSFAYYASAQDGSASIKTVLPALTGLSYDHLAIRDGTTASQEYLRVTRDDVPVEERDRVRGDLLTYCGMDTDGMISMVAALRKLVASEAEAVPSQARHSQQA